MTDIKRSDFSRREEDIFHAGFMSAENDWRRMMDLSDMGESALWVRLAKKDLIDRYGTIWPPDRAEHFRKLLEAFTGMAIEFKRQRLLPPKLVVSTLVEWYGLRDVLRPYMNVQGYGGGRVLKICGIEVHQPDALVSDMPVDSSG